MKFYYEILLPLFCIFQHYFVTLSPRNWQYIMKNTIFCWLLSLLYAAVSFSSFAGEDTNEKVLRQLDAVIAHKDKYIAEKESRVEGLHSRLRSVADPRLRYQLCDTLFREYLHFQTDSALHYVRAKRQLLPLLVDSLRLRSEVGINQAEVLGVMGMYPDALAQLQSIRRADLDKPLLAYYLETFRAYYSWVADYATNPAEKKRYLNRAQAYRDSIIGLGLVREGYEFVVADHLLFRGKVDSAIVLLERTLERMPAGRARGYVYHTLSEAYRVRGAQSEEIRFLALTAINDLEHAVREYAALHKLANLMYQTDQLDRAYRYLNCSLEDANACNSRLRFIEVSQFFHAIDQAYKLQKAREQRIVLSFLILVSALSFFLLVAIFYLYRNMKRLSAMRLDLSQANLQLQQVNQALSETGKIKEIYIARYLDRCVTYLDKLSHYRRALAKLAMASRMEELMKAIKSEQFIRDEQKKFYDDFDRSFLTIFPHFIDQFNALLEEEARIEPKKGELLTTELRIFALIRLGISDTKQIAHFLGYSLATIYNYRSRIRNKSLANKELFEQKVMEIN